MIEEIDKLIEQGKTFNFKNNSETTSLGTFSKASDELLGWTASVEDFIIRTYGEQSGPYKLYSNFNRRNLTGYEEEEFEAELNILLGSLKACKSANPIKKTKPKEDNQILNLIKNPIFWTVILVLIGASFSLGVQFGSIKFDTVKIELVESNNELKKTLENQNVLILKKDTMINNLIKESDELKKKVNSKEE